MQRIILASTSPARQLLARTIGLDFEVVPSNYKEDMTLNLSPKELVIELALGKARDVAKNLKEELVIGVDTIVVFDGKVFGKPKDSQEAIKMLRLFSGKKHEIYSGIVLINCATGATIKDFEVTKVYFKELSDKEILSYVKTGEPFGKSGSYGIQGLASIFVEKVEGCYFNIVGFPVNNIYKNLEKMGINIFEHKKWKV
jgi:septum formation protein